jgi:hypothetical protein
VAYTYRPRGMPARFMQDAPAIVRAQVLDLIQNPRNNVCEFDVILRPEPNPQEIVGLDFDNRGRRGCHFFLKPSEARNYRDRNRRKRIAWRDLPEPTRAAIVAYLQED